MGSFGMAYAKGLRSFGKGVASFYTGGQSNRVIDALESKAGIFQGDDPNKPNAGFSLTDINWDRVAGTGALGGAIYGLASGNLFGSGKPTQDFMAPRIGDIPIVNPVPFTNPLANLAGIDLSTMGYYDAVPEGYTPIGGIKDRNLMVLSRPYSPEGGAGYKIDPSFLTSPDVPDINSLSAYKGLDLTPPDAPILPDRIAPYELPTPPSFGDSYRLSQSEERYLGDIIDQVIGQGALRGFNPSGGFKTSPEAMAEKIAGPISDFRARDVNQRTQIWQDTVRSLDSIYGGEIAQRAQDIASNNSNYQAQLARVTSLTNKMAELEVQLTAIKVGANTERQRLRTQLEIAQLQATLEKERITLDAATSLAQIAQGTGIVGGPSEGILGKIMGAYGAYKAFS